MVTRCYRTRNHATTTSSRRSRHPVCCLSVFFSRRQSHRKEVSTCNTQSSVTHPDPHITGTPSHDDENEAEMYYTAHSLFFDDNTMVETPYGEVGRVEDLDKASPAPIPPAAISALNLVPPFYAPIPQMEEFSGGWRKDFAASTPTPNDVETMLNTSILVQSVRKRISAFEIRDTPQSFSFVVKIPVPGYRPRVETFQKDGSIVKLHHRRDDRSGRAFGQAFMMTDGRILFRVWNLGSSPEVMWQEIFELLTPTRLKVEHSLFTLDGTRTAKKLTFANKC